MDKVLQIMQNVGCRENNYNNDDCFSSCLITQKQHAAAAKM